MENKGTDNASPPEALDILSEIPADGASAVPAPEATSLDTGPASATADLYRAAVGKVNTDFYQRVFERFESTERTGPTWNWAAALLTVNWMAFRQLWAAAIVYVGTLVLALILVLGLGRLVFHWPSPVEMGLLALLALLSVVVPGAFGNTLLHAASRKKMALALAANTTVPEACAMLEKQASSKQRLIWIALANAVLVGATVGISMALPDADRLPLNTPAPEQAPPAASAAASAPAITIAAPIATPTTAASDPVAAVLPAAPASAPASSPAPAPLPAPQASAAAIASAPPAVLNSAPPVPLAPPVPAVVEKPVVPEKPVAKTTPASPSKPANKTKASAAAANTATSDAAAGKKIYINVGLFAKESNAHSAHDKLAKAGLPAKEQQVKGTKGTFTRVRVGPYKTMAAAEKAAEKIRGQGLEAVVVRQ